MVLALAAGAPAYGIGPFDGELAVDWWANDPDANLDDGPLDAGSLSGFAEVWWNENWGVRGARYETTLEDIGFDSSDHISLDVKRRFFSLTDSSFVALGAGWQNIDLDTGGSSSGLRLTAEGRVGLGGAVSLYGQTSWLP
ncbi:MAG: hypothetical protein DWQ08_09710, partial [Proteobacteria bacterium]